MKSILEIGLKTQAISTGSATAVRAIDDIKRKSRDTTKSIDGMESSFGKLKNMIFSVKGLMVGIGTSWLARDFIRAASDMENYGVRLKILLGDTQKASDLFQSMSKYASQVPFEYRDVMASATTLAGVVKGGVAEVNQWIPLIGDLAAASGMGMQETTGQVIRMLSAGASAADMFRERGILAMLGFKSGVKYSVDETKKMLLDAWTDPESKFKGATEELKSTWTGLMSMLSDAWMQTETLMMNSGVFDFLKSGIKSITDELKGLNESLDKGGFLKSYLDKLKSNPMTSDNWLTKQLENYVNPSKPREIYSSAAIQVRKNGTSASGTNFISPDDVQMQESISKLKKFLDEANGLYRRSIDENDASKILKEEAEAAEKAIDKLSKLNQIRAELNSGLLHGRALGDPEAAARINDLANEAEKNLDVLADAHQTFFDRFSDQVNSYKNQFTEAFINLPNKGMESFKDMFDSILKDVARFQINKFITEPLSGGLNSWISGLVGRASGGPVYSGSSYIVGENGPELFTPGASGNITPNNALGGVNIQVQVVGTAIPNNASVRVEQQSSGINKLFKIVVDKVAEDIVDGGSVARALDTRFGLNQRGY